MSKLELCERSCIAGLKFGSPELLDLDSFRQSLFPSQQLRPLRFQIEVTRQYVRIWRRDLQSLGRCLGGPRSLSGLPLRVSYKRVLLLHHA